MMIRPSIVTPCLVILLSALSVGTAYAEVRSLEQCVRTALETSPRLSGSAAQVSAARAAAAEARAGRWPTFALDGSYALTSETMTLQLPGSAAFAPPEIEFGDGNAFDVHLSARVVLYSGGAITARIHAQEAALRATEFEESADRLDILYEVRRAFYHALGTEAQLQSARVAQERLARHLEQITAAVTIGTASEEARILSLARLRQAEQRALASEADVRARRLALGRVIGLAGVEIEPAGDLDTPLIAPDRLACADAAARPELAALDQRARQSDAGAAVARAAYRPSLAAQAGFHEAKPGIDLVTNEWMDYATAGVVVSWSLWEWGARANRIERAHAQSRAIDQQRRALADGFTQALATARITWEAARGEETKVRERVALEQRRLELVIGRYREASASVSERLDAEDDLTAAESDLAAARVKVRLAAIEILRFCPHGLQEDQP